MPKMYGVAATGRVRESRPEMRVLMLTTYEGDADVLRAFDKLGARDRTSAVTEALRRGIIRLDP